MYISISAETQCNSILCFLPLQPGYTPSPLPYPTPHCCSVLPFNSTAALCSAAADITCLSSLHPVLLNTSNTSVFDPTCLSYLATLQCLHNLQNNATLLATLIQECVSLVNTTCSENTTFLLCHNTSSCDPLANCSATPPVTMDTDPPTTTVRPNEVRFGPLTLGGLIGVAVGGVAGLLLLCLLCICLCACVWCCCCCGQEGGEEGGGVKVGETTDSAEAGITMFNPMALEQ